MRARRLGNRPADKARRERQSADAQPACPRHESSRLLLLLTTTPAVPFSLLNLRHEGQQTQQQ